MVVAHVFRTVLVYMNYDRMSSSKKFYLRKKIGKTCNAPGA